MTPKTHTETTRVLTMSGMLKNGTRMNALRIELPEDDCTETLAELRAKFPGVFSFDENAPPRIETITRRVTETRTTKEIK